MQQAHSPTRWQFWIDRGGTFTDVVAKRPDGAIVLECANMPPYRAAVAAAARMPVFDAAQLVAWFRQGL